jgi:hypothetical protein
MLHVSTVQGHGRTSAIRCVQYAGSITYVHNMLLTAISEIHLTLGVESIIGGCTKHKNEGTNFNQLSEAANVPLGRLSLPDGAFAISSVAQ